MATKEEVEKIVKETKYQKGVRIKEINSELIFVIDKIEPQKNNRWTMECGLHYKINQ